MHACKVSDGHALHEWFDGNYQRLEYTIGFESDGGNARLSTFGFRSLARESYINGNTLVGKLKWVNCLSFPQTFLRCCFWIWIEMQKVQSHCSLLEKPSEDMTHPLSSINRSASSLFRNDLQNSSHSLVLPKIHGMLKIVEIILKLCI